MMRPYLYGCLFVLSCSLKQLISVPCHTHIYRTYRCTYTRPMHTHRAYAHTHAHTHVHAHTCTHIHTSYIHMIHTYMHAHMHTRVHTNTLHTHKPGISTVVSVSNDGQYGTQYKIVPETTQNFTNRVTCFKIPGMQGAAVMPQGVLPNITAYNVSVQYC